MASLGSLSLDKKVICEECNNEWNLVKKFPKEEIEDKISRYLNTPVQLRGCITYVPSRQSQLSSSLLSPIPELPKSDEQIHYNAVAQKAASAKKKELEKELDELQVMARITINPEYNRNFSSKISDIKKPETNSAIVEDFSMLSSSLGITDHESIAIAVALDYISD
ncbi:18008_t:CDS:2 [Racocetra fulgida]|uniref:18008_t:CDS:1 n=1 Tax=Racocetra fulgida TaxID=60492 RepID=A0A9N9AZU2_9GLOM|nr:18008_t:CDS:2 [Racocetra fulgida]